MAAADWSTAGSPGCNRGRWGGRDEALWLGERTDVNLVAGLFLGSQDVRLLSRLGGGYLWVIARLRHREAEQETSV